MYSSNPCFSRLRHRIEGPFNRERKKIIASKEMQICLFGFLKKDADNITISHFGEKLLCLFYDSKINVSLNSLRYRLFQRKIATATNCIAPESIPPTSDAAMFHSYRAYHQT